MDPPNRRQEASALSETSYLADVIILTARKVSTPIILVAATIARADHTIIVIGQCPYQHTPVFCCQMVESTPSARSHPIIGSTQANNWWPITRNWSIVCVCNILGVCWSKQEEDWWVWLLYKSRAINLHCKEKVQGKKLEDMCNDVFSWDFMAIPIGTFLRGL